MTQPARTLMIQGSMSSAGKSLLVTALCHMFARRGVRVAPFKAQNMSNNAAVCTDGGEIGRAQYTQALAAGVAPTVQMNPVLLKPEADARSQVIVNGRVWQTFAARDYYTRKRELWAHVTAALDALRADYELVIIEGAGSPVELNLKRGDIVNMAVARYAQSPVLLVGDIDRGGIFAQLLGTLLLMDDDERQLVRGLVVNKFRGDPTLFTDGIAMLEERGGVPVLGVVPYLPAHGIPEEDAVAVEDAAPAPPAASVDIAVIRLPRIANFDDFDPLTAEPGVGVRYVADANALGSPSAVILPGTKSTIADLAWLQASGLAGRVCALAAQGVPVVGICGGYQMLGTRVADPHRVESDMGAVAGLGLLDVETTFIAEKSTQQTQVQAIGGAGWLHDLAGHTLHGYEIHIGQTTVQNAWLASGSSATSTNGRVWGCYLHGLFENDVLRWAWLRSLGWGSHGAGNQKRQTLSGRFSLLADHVQGALNMDVLERIVKP